jgi:hypothetical protein
VAVVKGLQTKVIRPTDISTLRQQQAATAAAAAAAAAQLAQPVAAPQPAEGSRAPLEDESMSCSYELQWQMSQPSAGKLLKSTEVNGQSALLRQAGRLSVTLHEIDTDSAAASQPAKVLLQLCHKPESTATVAAANMLAVLQQVNSVPTLATDNQRLSVQAAVPSSLSRLGPDTGLQLTARRGAADAFSAVWGLMRTEASEQAGTAVSLVDEDSNAAAESWQQDPPKVAVPAAAGLLGASAHRSAAVAVPRLLTVSRPEAAEHFVVRPEPRSSLSNLVARAAALHEVCQPAVTDVQLYNSAAMFPATWELLTECCW